MKFNKCNIDLNNFLIIFFSMYKKHEPIIDFIFETTFLNIYESFEKYSKKLKYQNHQDQSVLLRRK